MEKNGFVKLRDRFLVFLVALGMVLVLPLSASAEDRLVVEDTVGTEVFKVTDTGAVTSVGTTFPVSKITRTTSKTGGGRGVAAFELASTGDMVDGFGPSFEFWISDDTYTAAKAIVTMVAGRDGSDDSGAWQLMTAKGGALAINLVVNSDGNLGVGTTSPQYLIDTGGAYCDGSDWISGSSREYKQNIQDLTADEAMVTLKDLNPVKFNYKKSPDQENLGFIAEDVPDLVATKDRKGMSSMDVVAVLTKVVQEQQRAISELREKVVELQAGARLDKVP